MGEALRIGFERRLKLEFHGSKVAPLLETAVYGRLSEKEWAEAHGANHSTVRSWRLRAVQAIRKYEEARRG